MNKYLIEILKIQNSVILPGLGALMVPSQKSGQIVFNQHLKFNDGSLARFIAEKEGIDTQESQNKVAKFVREIEAEIGKGNAYDMFEFGKFFKNSEGIVDFTMHTTGKSDEKVTEEVKPEAKKETKAPVVTPADILANEKKAEDFAKEKENAAAEKLKAEEIAKKAKEAKEAAEKKAKEEAEQLKADAAKKAKEETEKLKAEAEKIAAKKAAEAAALIASKKDTAESTTTKVDDTVKTVTTAPTVNSNATAPEELPTNKPTDAISTADKIALDKQSKNTYTPVGTTGTDKPTPPVETSKPTPVIPKPADQPTAPSPAIPNSTDKEEKKKRSKLPWIILLLVLIALAVVGFIFKDQILAYFDKDKTEAITPADSTKTNEMEQDTVSTALMDESSDTLNESQQIENEPIQEEPQEEPKVETPVHHAAGSNNGVYHLIGNSFSEEANAKRYAQTMQDKGYPAKIIGRYDGLYLVSLKSYDSRDAAQAGRSSVSADASSAWVFKKN